MNDLASFIAKGYVRNQDGSYSQPSRADDTGQPAVTEQCPRAPASKAASSEKGNSAKFLVRITDVRKHLLDSDNLMCKFHVDCCRYAGLLPSDAPGTTTIQVEQRKARRGEPPYTQILIESCHENKTDQA